MAKERILTNPVQVLVAGMRLPTGRKAPTHPGRWNQGMTKIRALIVDDSSVMRKIVERSLRQAGIELDVVQALSFGVRGYMRKPFTPDQVKEQVLPVLGKKP